MQDSLKPASCTEEFPIGLCFGKKFSLPDNGYVQKAYDNPSNASQIDFNVALRKARSTVERTFGRLKERWRLLRSALEFETEMNPLIVVCCCVLHNVCEMNSLEIIEDAQQNDETWDRANYSDTSRNTRTNHEAEQVRSLLASLF